MEGNIRANLFKRFIEIIQKNRENSDIKFFIRNIVNIYIKLFYYDVPENKCPRVENGRRWTYIISFSDFVEKKEDGLFHIKNMDFIELSCNPNVLKDLKKLVEVYNSNEQHREQINETNICVLRIVNSCFGFSHKTNINTCLVCHHIYETMEYVDIDIKGSWAFEEKQELEIPKPKRSLDERLYFPNHKELISFKEIECFQEVQPEQQLIIEKELQSGITLSPKCSKNPEKQQSSKSLMKQRSRSPVMRHRERSRSPMRRHRERSRSPMRRQRERSRSPMRRQRERSRSPMRRHRERSRSPVMRHRERSRSPVRRHRERSRSPMRQHHFSRSQNNNQQESSSRQSENILDQNLIKNIIAMNSFLLKYAKFENN